MRGPAFPSGPPSPRCCAARSTATARQGRPALSWKPRLVAAALRLAEKRERQAAALAGRTCDPQDVFERFLRHLVQHLDRSPETERWYRGKLGPLFQAWEGVPLPDWTPARMEAWIREHRKDGAECAWSASSVAGLVTAARRFVAWSQERGEPIPDFVGHLRRPRAYVTEPLVLTEPQVLALLEAAEVRGPRVAIALAAFAGLRRAEIIRLTWSMVDLEEDVLRVPEKTRRERLVPIHPRLREVLLEVPQAGGPLLRTHRHGAALYGALKRVYERAEISWPEGRPLHVLRHSCASILLARGAPVTAVRDILGHACQGARSSASVLG